MSCTSVFKRHKVLLVEVLNKLETTCLRNIHVKASKSGKMTKEHLKCFVTSILGKHVTNEEHIVV